MLPDPPRGPCSVTQPDASEGSDFPRKLQYGSALGSKGTEPFRRWASLIHQHFFFCYGKASVVLVFVLIFTAKSRVPTRGVSLLPLLGSTTRGKDEVSSLPKALTHLAPVLQGKCCQPDGREEP